MVLDRDEVPSEPEVARLMRQILDGLHYLHTINVAHLDIKVKSTIKIVIIRQNYFLDTTFSNNNIPSPIIAVLYINIIYRNIIASKIVII